MRRKDDANSLERILVLTCHACYNSTGDVAWLKGYLPTLRLGLSYLTGMVNS
eukprot:SAG22_NODE_4194_length_1351_cov_3.504792_1_plen_51_part_10